MRAPAIAVAALLAGALLAAGLLLARPALYFALADRVAWRLGTPVPGQTRLDDTLHTLYRRGDALIGPTATLLLGDGHLHGFPVSRLAWPAYFVNLTMFPHWFEVPYVDGAYWSLGYELHFDLFVWLALCLGLMPPLPWLLAAVVFAVFGLIATDRFTPRASLVMAYAGMLTYPVYVIHQLFGAMLYVPLALGHRPRCWLDGRVAVGGAVPAAGR